MKSRFFLPIFVAVLGFLYFQCCLALPLSTSARAVVRKQLTINDLNVYKILHHIQYNMNRVTQESINDGRNTLSKENEKIISSVLYLVNESIKLLENIVTALNKQSFSYNPEIEYRFLKMCNILQDIDVREIEPRHIRRQLEITDQFNQQIHFYCMSRKQFLKPEDIELFNTITSFNYILMKGLLREEYFEIGFFDIAVDSIIYKPLEFLQRNPLVTGILAASIAAYIGYYYVYPYFAEQNSGGTQDPTTYTNENRNFNVQQLRGLQQRPRSAECPYYSLLHALMLRNANNNEQEFNEMMARATEQPNLLQPWMQFVSQIPRDVDAYTVDDRGNLSRETVARILSNRQLVNQVMQPIVGAGNVVHTDNVAIIDPSSRHEQQEAWILAQLQANVPVDRIAAHVISPEVMNALGLYLQDATNIDTTTARVADTIRQYQQAQAHNYDIATNVLSPQFMANIGVQRVAGVRDDAADEFFLEERRIMNRVRNNIRRDVPQYVALRVRNHWISVALEPDPSNDYGVRARIIDSARFNNTNNPYLNDLLQECSTP